MLHTFYWKRNLTGESGWLTRSVALCTRWKAMKMKKLVDTMEFLQPFM